METAPDISSEFQEAPVPPQLHRKSSIELRRLSLAAPVSPSIGDEEQTLGSSVAAKEEAERQLASRGFFQRTCLRPSFQLRTQLMFSFGLVGAIAISCVVATCVLAAYLAGQNAKIITKESFSDLVTALMVMGVRYSAESLTSKMLPVELIDILYETTRDRFAGYPNYPGYDEDKTVPFLDVDSRTNIYPIVFPRVPLSWEVGDLVTEENFPEHVQERWTWYEESRLAGVSTAAPSYHVQGVCNSSVTNPLDRFYYPNCTDANNNMTTGGLLPTPTNGQIHRKASDLSPMMKSLYEYHEQVVFIDVGFANSGVGSQLRFPQLIDTWSRPTYVSIGCEWMSAPNPYDASKPIGSSEEISRCHPNGTVVPFAEYNPLETSYCRLLALDPDQVHTSRPVVDPSVFKGSLFLVGRAVYDRITNEFIGCVMAGINGDYIQDRLYEAKATINSHITVVKWDDLESGDVVASTAWKMARATKTVKIDELNVGVDKKADDRFRSLVDYGTIWEPEKVKAQYRRHVIINDEFAIAGYPIPPVPNQYDPNYKPEFFVIFSLSSPDLFVLIDSFNESVDTIVQEVGFRSILIGAVGLVFCTLIIIVVSRSLTIPLKSMNSVADSIVRSSGETSDEGKKIDVNLSQYELACSPETELSDVVREFQSMVSLFSGSAMAKAMDMYPMEGRNTFPFVRQFGHLYESRRGPGFNYSVAFPSKTGGSSSDRRMLHLGSNINITNPALSTNLGSYQEVDVSKKRCSSPLFLWIVVLLVVPLVLTTIAVSAVSIATFAIELPSIIDAAKEEYTIAVLFGLNVHTMLRSHILAAETAQSLGDLHISTRFASWLLFDGITRSDSFTELVTTVEKCKTEPWGQCDVSQEIACDCAWDRSEDLRTCQNYTVDSRYLQRIQYSLEIDNNDANGNRYRSSFPAAASAPNSTKWQTNVTTMPGFERGSSARGYNTTYDRARVLSAMPMITLTNADSLRRNSNFNVALEGDGMYLGYWGGCTFPALESISYFQMNEDSQKLRPELCPEGKFGYDPRCREWYDTGRRRFLESNESLYVTAPYAYGGGVKYAQSATSPLFEPRTLEHVGQVMIDFLNPALKTFDRLESDMSFFEKVAPILITVDSDLSGGDTVIGPGFYQNESALRIQSLLVPHDWNCTDDTGCLDMSMVESIVEDMKAGNQNLQEFLRTGDDGVVKTMYIMYAPVSILRLKPSNSSEFTRGVEASDLVVYSHALLVPESEIERPFKRLESELHDKAVVALIASAVGVFLVTSLMLFVSARVTTSITAPMVYLLTVIRRINKASIDEEDQPEATRNYGSREVRNVADTMEILYKVVQSANIAFYSGNIESAYVVLNEALGLFKRMDNKKAIGVASNNLGNIMLAAYRTLKATGETHVCHLTETEIIRKGLIYFDQAIKLGEKAYDDFYDAQGWSPDCLFFMQHLSNRYFNRGMFLLTVKNSYERSDELEETGLRDIQIAKDMDVEIVDQGTEVGWEVNTPEKMFSVALSRIRGHMQLLEMGYSDDWETKELLEESFDLVKRETGKPGSALFKDFSPTGRLQQIEVELIRYCLLRSEVELAAKIAIRMLIEDEYTFPNAQEKAVEAVAQYYLALDGSNEIIKLKIESYREDLQEKNRSIEAMRLRDGPMPKAISRMKKIETPEKNINISMKSLQASSQGDVTMEVF